ncbi:MAG: nucleotidyltransferase family protein [Verrucomicrobiae bacterium]|nr:nucleotidyltransferase family protein [Verrucomicrobiae bacterium]
MKAFLLAAGLGVRLRPLTLDTPKCLLPIGGKPLLGHWFDSLQRAGVKDVLLNTHYLSQQVDAFVKSWRGNMRVHTAYEPVLLGSAGTLRANRSFVENDESFLVCYADNWTLFNAAELIRCHEQHHGEHPLGTMLLHRTARPKECGIATLDARGWVTAFEEKPAAPVSNLANSGIYVFSRESLALLPPAAPADIARDFIPRLLPRLLGWESADLLVDIGSPASYQRANELHDGMIKS